VRHAIHPEADAEFAEAVRYYTEIAPDLGVRFYREMERLSRWLSAQAPRRSGTKAGQWPGRPSSLLPP
jgi:hypothetical protein